MMYLAFLLANLLTYLARTRGLLGRSEYQRLADDLEEASRDQGIRFAPRSFRSSTARGTCEDFSILVELKRPWEGSREEIESQVDPTYRVTIDGPRLPLGLRVAAHAGRGGDVLTGDTAFDEIIGLWGEPSVLLALLDREIRQRLSDFVWLGGRFEKGRLVCLTPTPFFEGCLAHLLRLGLWLARELSSPGGGVCGRLARNAKTDPLPPVRLWNLLQLQEQFPETAEAREASRQDLKDPSPWVRLAAARFLKAESLEALEGLACERAVPEAAAAEAVALLAARCPADRVGPQLLTILKTRPGEVRHQAIQELGRIGYKPALGALMVLLETSDPRTAAAAAGALGALGDVSAEPSLLRAVENEAWELRLAAIGALGTLGTVASVEPLLALLGSRNMDRESRVHIRGAVGSIQSRLAGAEAGQLSLASNVPGSGWLSVATPDPGQGQLSLISAPKKA